MRVTTLKVARKRAFECFKAWWCARSGETHNVQSGLELNRVTNGFELWYWAESHAF